MNLREEFRRTLPPIFLIALLLSVTPPSGAQGKHTREASTSEDQRPASDAHSFMELFGKLERDWGLAAEKKDHKFLDDIMAEEFSERTAADPQNKIAKASWIQKRLLDYDLDPLQIRSMTIRAFMEDAVVSFVQSRKATKNSASQGADVFIVDVWVVNHGKWQVASRFSSAVPH